MPDPTTDSASDFPRYFLVKLARDGEAHYLVCEAVVAVNEGALPEAVARTVNEAFLAARGDDAQVVELPNPGDRRGWLALQMTFPVPPRPLG